MPISDPTDIPGLLTTIRADAGVFQDTGFVTPTTTNGQDVLGWRDQSGLNHHWTRLALGSTTPIWLANGVAAGKPSVQLRNYPLVTGNIGPLDRRTSTIFAVVSTLSRASAPLVNYASVAGSMPDDWALFGNAFGVPGYEQAQAAICNVQAPYTRYYLIGIRFSASGVRFSVNDRFSPTYTRDIAQTAFEGLGIGTRTSIFGDCAIAQLSYYNRSVTTSEWADYIDYSFGRYPSIVSPAPVRHVVGGGNSIMRGAFANLEPFIHKACVDAEIAVEDTYNTGVNGRQTPEVTAGFDAEVTPLFDADLPSDNIFVLWENGNHAAFGADLETVKSATIAAAAKARSVGYKFIATSMIDRSSLFSGVTKAAFQTLKNANNAWIRINWPTFADGFADPAANPLLGADDASLDTTYFSDGTHLTQAGHDLAAAPLVAPISDGYYAAPQIKTATINVNGDTATIVFTKHGKSPILPSSGASGFTFNANGGPLAITASSISGVTATVTLSRVVGSGETVTLTYVPGNVHDSDSPSNALTPFAGFLVTNASQSGGAQFPDEEDVRNGVVYGPNGDDFTGTLVESGDGGSLNLDASLDAYDGTGNTVGDALVRRQRSVNADYHTG